MTIRTLLVVYAALIALLAVTVAVSFVELGRFSLVVALLVAGAKSALVIVYFMHAREGGRVAMAFAVAAALLLASLVLLTLVDSWTR